MSIVHKNIIPQTLKKIHKKVIDAIDRVGLKDKLRCFPNQLSGGEQQRVCIARAIVNDPKLIICDEPTGDLDPKLSREVMDVIEKINKELGSTIIMATHDKEKGGYVENESI